MRYLFLLLSILLATPSAAQQFDTVYVYFDIGSYQLDKASQATLDTLAQQLAAPTATKLLVYGYADYLGTATPNKTLSQQRADAVARYLQHQQVATSRFLVVQGLGQFNDRGAHPEKGNIEKRKTMILITRRSQSNTSASPAPPAASQQLTPPQASYTTQRITNFDTIPAAVRQEIEKNISLIQTTPVEATFVLENIYFQIHTAIITQASLPTMQALLAIMQNFPDLKINIEGHICCNELDGMDPRTAAYQLSVKRAQKIYAYLVKNGISPRRVSYKGFGRTRPLFPAEATHEEMAANRRVEIRIKAK